MFIAISHARRREYKSLEWLSIHSLMEEVFGVSGMLSFVGWSTQYPKMPHFVMHAATLMNLALKRMHSHPMVSLLHIALNFDNYLDSIYFRV